MKPRRFHPKLNKKLLAKHSGHAVYAVNSFAVRDAAQPDEEFGGFAMRDEFPDMIPEGEIWISEKSADREGLFYIANGLAQLKAKDDGVPEDTAYTTALNIERLLRERLTGERFRAGRPHKRVPRRVYREHYLTLPDEKFPIDVWVVDGCLVRSWYKTDYTEGGHGYVYPWVPKQQIWIDDDVDRRERPFMVVHEYLELRLMRDAGLEYDPAHAICSKVEFHCRQGEAGKLGLVRGRRRLHKRDLDRLTRAEAFAYVLRHYVRNGKHG